MDIEDYGFYVGLCCVDKAFAMQYVSMEEFTQEYFEDYLDKHPGNIYVGVYENGTMIEKLIPKITRICRKYDRVKKI